MERYVLTAAPRQMVGRLKVKRLRREGWLPAVIYGRGINPTPLQVREEDFQQMLRTVGHNVMVDLKIDGHDVTHTVMVKKIQRDALTLNLLNVDFYRVSLTDTVTTRVPLELVGTPRGVAAGGMLLQPVSELEIRGVAANLPPTIQADVSNLDIDQALHVRDLKVPEGVEILAPDDEVVAIVHPPRVAEEAPAEAEKAAPTEEAAKEPQKEE